jgi:polysaccharide pyruvyl transferase WcaK-like protein
MQDLHLPGWELAHLPTNSHEISRAWIEQYANGEPLSEDQIHFLVDRALIHRECLHQALALP